jgi:hypothetical protein
LHRRTSRHPYGSVKSPRIVRKRSCGSHCRPIFRRCEPVDHYQKPSTLGRESSAETESFSHATIHPAVTDTPSVQRYTHRFQHAQRCCAPINDERTSLVCICPLSVDVTGKFCTYEAEIYRNLRVLVDYLGIDRWVILLKHCSCQSFAWLIWRTDR